MHSNSTEDVTVTRLSGMSRQTQDALVRIGREKTLQLLTWPVSFLVAVLAWLTAWRYAMPRLLGVQYRWRDFRLYSNALGWALLYPVTNVAAFAVGIAVVIVLGTLAIVIEIPLLALTLSGAVSIVLFTLERSRKLGVSYGKPFRAYAAVVLLANAAYLLLALGYAALLGV